MSIVNIFLLNAFSFLLNKISRPLKLQDSKKMYSQIHNFQNYGAFCIDFNTRNCTFHTNLHFPNEASKFSWNKSFSEFCADSKNTIYLTKMNNLIQSEILQIVTSHFGNLDQIKLFVLVKCMVFLESKQNFKKILFHENFGNFIWKM